jgi:hypothetical protein
VIGQPPGEDDYVFDEIWNGKHGEYPVADRIFISKNGVRRKCHRAAFLDEECDEIREKKKSRKREKYSPIPCDITRA